MRLILSLILAASAFADGVREDVIIKPGYNFREARFTTGKLIRTIRRATPATLLERRGSWRKVCIGGRGRSCQGGTLGWIIRTGLKRPAPDAQNSQDGVSDCYGGGCANKPKRPFPAVEEIADDLDANPAGEYALPYPMFARECATFISKKGWGEWGRLMDRAARTVAPRCMFERNLFGSICPNYKNLSPKKKNAMIALTFAAMAMQESTCNPNARAQGVNDIADGMFQHEKTMKARKKADRSKRWCRSDVEIPNAKEPTFQSECTVSIIDDRICTLGAYIFDENSYWNELRGSNGAITRRIKHTVKAWKLCD